MNESWKYKGQNRHFDSKLTKVTKLKIEGPDTI